MGMYYNGTLIGSHMDFLLVPISIIMNLSLPEVNEDRLILSAAIRQLKVCRSERCIDRT